jgi:hypothetical protein
MMIVCTSFPPVDLRPTLRKPGIRQTHSGDCVFRREGDAHALLGQVAVPLVLRLDPIRMTLLMS